MKREFVEISVIVVNIDCEMKLSYSNGINFLDLLTEEEEEDIGDGGLN